MTLRVPEGDPLAGLAAALAPFGWFTHDLQAVKRLDGGFPWQSVEFTGCLTRAPGEPLPRSQREGRRAMYEQAEAVITAARDAGWLPWKPPEIEIGGGDGIGSCECPRCDRGEAAASSVLCTCPPDDIGGYWDDDDFLAYLPEGRVGDMLRNPDNRHLY